MKPGYEKPIAIPLGEITEGSGQCNAGSAVSGVGLSVCSTGSYPGYDCRDGSHTSYICAYGTGANSECVSGNLTENTCAGGISPFGRCMLGPSPTQS